MSVVVIAPRSGLPPPLEIGSELGKARAAIGPPTSEAGDSLTWVLSAESGDTFTMTGDRGKLKAVRWSYYVD